MGIKEQIGQDLTEAMKARDRERVEALRLIRAEVLKREKEKGAGETDDAIMTQILRSMLKQRQESIEIFEKGNRHDLVAKEMSQLKVIESYLPAPLDESRIDQMIDAVLSRTGATSVRDMGKVMGMVMKELKDAGGLFDGSVVNAKVKQRLR